MAHTDTKGIVVLDIGSTNTKAMLFDRDLNELASRTIPTRRLNEPYLSEDTGPLLEFLLNAISEFDKLLPVDTIVPCAHGSALALLDDTNELALPIMSYEAQPPEPVCSEYELIAPSFDEVFAPTNPGALTLGRQLLWQETQYPEAFSKVRTILPLGQYVAFLLCGELASEVTALGAQTHLWDPVNKNYSKLAKSRGWANRFAPMRNAWDPLGQIRGVELSGQGNVLAGIHDSNANLLGYLGGGEFCLLSTGTWLIAFDTAIAISRLQPEFDQVSNTNLLGEPVACCRFMAGREFEIVADGDIPDGQSIGMIAELIKTGTFALPSFTDSGGPVPGSGGKGRIAGNLPDVPGYRASMSSLYCAQMTALALARLGTSERIIVDGPFAANSTYLSILAGLMSSCEIVASNEPNGTSRGAAMLALMGDSNLPAISPSLTAVDNAQVEGLSDYHNVWLAMVG
ncbi:MAG: FGGY-family carbohydrate kinase [Rhizobiaceae bacterium]